MTRRWRDSIRTRAFWRGFISGMWCTYIDPIGTWKKLRRGEIL